MNEETIIYSGDWDGNWHASAWRRIPEHPDWKVTVKYGDTGYECDPGIYSEDLDYAIDEVRKSIVKLKALHEALMSFKKEQLNEQ